MEKRRAWEACFTLARVEANEDLESGQKNLTERKEEEPEYQDAITPVMEPVSPRLRSRGQ